MKPWHERDTSRYQADKEFWKGQGFREERNDDGLIAFRGVVSLTVSKRSTEPFERHTYDLTVTYPAGFPHFEPKVSFNSPSITRRHHQAPGGGAPCLFPPEAWTSEATPNEYLGALKN